MTVIMGYLKLLCALLFASSSHATPLLQAQSWNITLPNPQQLIQNAIKALGGEENLRSINGITVFGNEIYRSRSLMESYSLMSSDTVTAGSGGQNLSYSYDATSQFSQRIDRQFRLGPFWIFARPSLRLVEYSLVIKTGDEGFACVVKGTSVLFAPDITPSGYVDGLQAAYFIHDANQWNPLLIRSMASSTDLVTVVEKINSEVSLQGAYDPASNLTLLFDPVTSLPSVVRSREDHRLFGPSTRDLYLNNYGPHESGIQFPQRFKVIYNNEHLLQDFVADSVATNPTFLTGFFDGLPNRPEDSAPREDPAYGMAEVAEWTANSVWSGPYQGSLANLTATQPFPDIPRLWHLIFTTSRSQYRQVILDFDDAVIVLDAPGHQSFLIMQWVRENLGKEVTHVWPTHHHHDHALGATDYVASGAKLIVLDIAEEYYSNIPGVEFVLYSNEEPFIHKDDNMQFVARHIEKSSHAQDMAYGAITPLYITSNSSIAIYEADVPTGPTLTQDEHTDARDLLSKLFVDKVSRTATIIAAHGDLAPLAFVANITAFSYPAFAPPDFLFI